MTTGKGRKTLCKKTTEGTVVKIKVRWDIGKWQVTPLMYTDKLKFNYKKFLIFKSKSYCERFEVHQPSVYTAHR